MLGSPQSLEATQYRWNTVPLCGSMVPGDGDVAGHLQDFFLPVFIGPTCVCCLPHTATRTVKIFQHLASRIEVLFQNGKLNMSLVVPNYVKSKRNFISDEFCHFCSVAFLIDELGLFSPF